MKFWKHKTRQFFALIMTAVLFAGSADYTALSVSAKEMSEDSDATLTDSETVLPETASGDDSPEDSASTALLQSNLEALESEDGIVTEITGELTDLGDTYTSAPGGISLFSMDNGSVELKDGSYVNWIDRLDLPDYAINFYNTLVEASDNDGIDDFLIDDCYFSSDDACTKIKISSGDYHGILVETLFSPDELSQDDPTRKYISKCIRAVYDAFDRDHPEVFWLNGKTSSYTTWQSIYDSTGSFSGYKYNFYFLLQSNDSDGEWDLLSTMYPNESSIKAAIQTRDNNVSQILNNIQNNSDTESQIRTLNDWLTNHNEYNTDLDQAKENYPVAWECVSALQGLTGTEGPVCEGYSRAFKVLCDKLGIPCVLVDGNAQSKPTGSAGAHMWNYVELNGSWYAVDVTWNDPTVSGISGAVSGYETDKWLLLCSDSPINDWTFIESHPVENRVSVNGIEFINGPQLITTAENQKTNISTADITLESDSYIYNGKPCEPEVKVTLNEQNLTKDVDYTVSYENNINAGTAAVTVTAKGNYRGKITKDFTIGKADNTITLTKNSYTCSASPSSVQTFSIEASANGCSIEYQSDNSSVTVNASGVVTIPVNYTGTTKITVNAQGNDNYNAAEPVEVTVNVTPIDNTITASDIITGTSSATQSYSIEPAYNGNGAVTYQSDNENIMVDQTGTVTISANYSGSAAITIRVAADGIYKETAKTITVTVKQTMNSSNTSVSLKNVPSGGYIYNGKPYEPEAIVTWNGQILTKDRDYTVSYQKNTNAGTATVTIKAIGDYLGEISASFPIRKADNTITLTKTSYTYSASSSKVQTFSIEAKAAGGSVTYQSSNASVTVNASGKVTIPKNFAGTVKIMVNAPENTNYNAAAEKTVTLQVSQIANTITASNVTKTASARAQSFSINAKRGGSGKLTYSSNNKSVKVNSSGKVTIAKNFVGKARITIKSAASGIYKAASRTITVTVNPANTSISSVKNSASRKMTVKWKKSTAVTGYQIQYSTNKRFKTGVKTVTIKKNRTVSTTVSKLKKGKTYYTRIRTYKTVSGTKYYSNWSGSKTVKITK